MDDPGLRSLLDVAQTVRRTDTQRCLEMLDRAAAHPDVHDDHVAAARLATLRGQVGLDRGDVFAALTAFQVARMRWLSVGRPLEARGAMLGRTAVLLEIGEYDEVIGLVGRILSGVEGVSTRDEELATRLHLHAHQQLGAAHAARGDHARAMRYFDLADDVAIMLRDLHEVAVIGLRRGRALAADGLVHRALDVLCDARQTFLQAGSEAAAVRATLPIAEALSQVGSPVSAIELLERVSVDGGNAAERDRVLAVALLSAGLAEEAYHRGRAAREAFRAQGRIAACARAELVCAGAALRTGRPHAAVDSLLSAARLSTECGDTVTRDRARVLAARMALFRGDHTQALGIAQRLEKEGATEAARVHGELIRARATDDLAEAEQLIASSANQADRLAQPELRLELRLVRAQHLRRIDSPAGAAEELRAAAEMGDLVAQQSTGRGGMHDGTLARVTDELIDVLVEDGGHAAQIEAWQRVRASKVKAFTALREHAEGWHVDDAAGSVDDVDALIEGARAASRGYRPAGPCELPPVPEGPALELYVLGPDVIAFVIREGQVFVRRLGRVAAETERLVTAWHQECLLATAVGPVDDGSPSLDGLYAHLVAPLADLLVDLECEPLVVFGHRHLLAVPFDALLDVDAPWRRRLTPSYDGPGAAPHAEPPLEESPEEAPPVATLVLAVPDEQAPAIAAEATMIAELVPGAEVHLGAEATSAVLAERVAAAELVHIAAHGRFRAGNPLFSALHLGDGWLTAAALVDGRFDLQGRVVVLSACVSGRVSASTPRPIGLAWACLNAGAVGVVAALWPIDDQVTVTLMRHFYQAIAAGQHPRQALSRARRLVAEEYPHPSYWAAFRYFSASA